jgi:hypothetical protein
MNISTNIFVGQLPTTSSTGWSLRARTTFDACAGAQSLRRICLRIGLALALGLLALQPAQALDRTWIGGNVNWVDGGSTANWSPADEPDPDDTAIFNTPNLVNLGSSNSILALTMSGGIDLFTGGFQLSVATQTTLDGASTTLRVESNAIPANTSFQTLDLDLSTGGALVMSGGIATIAEQLEINMGSLLTGFGVINVGDPDLVVEQAFENSGLIQVVGNTAAPQTLTIHANGVDTIDLDGDSEVGVVDVANASANINADTLTLVIDGPLTDPFGALAGAALQIGQRDTLTFTANFQIATNTAVDLNGGNNVATLNGAGDITSIVGATFTVAGSALIANDMTFVGPGNTVTTASGATLALGGTVAVPDASMFGFGASSFFVVSGATTITEAAGDFDWDGGSGTVTTTIQGTGQLTLNVDHVDIASDTFNGTLNLNDNGDVAVNVTPGFWTMAGTVNKNNAGTSTVSGDPVNLTGAVHVNAGTLNFPTTTLLPGSELVADGILSLGAASVFAGNTSITGAGTLRLLGTSTVASNVTIAVNTFDWDGSGTGTTHTINSNANFTITATIFDSDGDMDDPIDLAGGGTLTFNGPPSWVMLRAFDANFNGAGTATIAGTSRMILSNNLAVMTVNGTTVATAPVTFGAGSTGIIAAASLRLNGGDAVSNFNRMAGGLINGPGTLAMSAGHELQGFGTIKAPIDFDSTGSLRANDGILIVSDSIIDVGTIGTADADGILDVTNAWTSSVAANVLLNGGELKGGTLTIANVNGVVGHGLLSSRVINNQKIVATNGTLIVQTTGNDNDWDGAGNSGLLQALGGATLEIRDNATFGFAGVVSASGGSLVLSSNFALDFNLGSTLNLTASKYESSNSTDLGGTVNINPGSESTIELQMNRFLVFEPTSVTTLGANLRLVNNNIIIEAGATFSGSGALIIPDGSHMVINDGANINALLDLKGALRPANSEGLGRVDVKDFQEAATSELFFEIAGTGLNQFDRLVVNGAAVLNGYLFLDIDGGFVPVVGNTFNIISASAGISGHFTAADIAGMPNGLTFQINYLPNAIQLSVVAGGTYETWISLFPSLIDPADRLKDADPDGDGLKNYAEFAFDDDPTSATESGKMVAKIAPVGGTNVLTLTFASRFAFPSPSDPPGNEFVFDSALEDLTYTIQAGDNVTTYTLNVTEVSGADAAAIQAGLPALNPNWVYRTFQCPDSVVGNPADFMKVIVSD